MKFRLAYILLVFSISFCLNSCFFEDSSSPSPEDTFLKVYGGVGSEDVTGIGINATGTEYYLLSTSTSNPNNLALGLSDIYIVRTDEAGNLLNDNYLNVNDGDTTEEQSASLKIFDTEIGVIGQSRTINDLGVFSKNSIFYSLLDFELGVTLADTLGAFGAFGITDEEFLDLEGNDIIKTQDGNFVLLATLGDAANQNRDIALIKISQENEIEWTRRISLPGDDAGVSVIEFPNGDLGVCGETSRVSITGRLGQNVLYLVTSESGFLRNSLAFGQLFGNNPLIDDIPSKMINDGAGAIILGNSQITPQEQMSFTLSLSQNGSISDLQFLEVNNIDNFSTRSANDIVRALNGEFLITGFATATTGGEFSGLFNQMTLSRLDQSGQSILSLTSFGDNNNEIGKGIIQLPNGSILIAATLGFGNNNNKIGLFKLNGNGQFER